jgi:hypothetical protein
MKEKYYEDLGLDDGINILEYRPRFS